MRELELPTSTEWQVKTCQQSHTNVHLVAHTPVFPTVQACLRVSHSLLCMVMPKQHPHTHIHLTALCPGLSSAAGTRKVKPIWILLKQEAVSSSGISWAICKSAPRSRQITMPAPHHSVFYTPDALPAA